MNKAKLFKMTRFSQDSILRILQETYQDSIRQDLIRMLGFSEEKIIDVILQNVHARLPEISTDCEIEHLVFDCVRKEVIRYYKTQPYSTSPIASILREARWREDTSTLDDARVDLLMLFLTKKQRKYFLDRYYYFRQDVTKKTRYEFVISRLINGKGIAAFRFRELKIPKKSVRSKDYVDYLDRLNGFYLGNFDKSGLLLESPRIINVPGTIRMLERHYRITMYSVPICCMTILLMMLVFWCLFTF